MTTAYSAQQSPRLPANHAEHVARILARSDKARQDQRKSRAIACVICISFGLTITAIFFLQ